MPGDVYDPQGSVAKVYHFSLVDMDKLAFAAMVPIVSLFLRTHIEFLKCRIPRYMIGIRVSIYKYQRKIGKFFGDRPGIRYVHSRIYKSRPFIPYKQIKPYVSVLDPVCVFVDLDRLCHNILLKPASALRAELKVLIRCISAIMAPFYRIPLSHNPCQVFLADLHLFTFCDPASNLRIKLIYGMTA